MRVAYLALLLVAAGTPAAAQSAQPLQVPPQLSDPRVADQLSRMTQALGNAFLNLPVGELEAAAEGRQATQAERRRTVRDAVSDDDPNFERGFREQLASTRPIMDSSMKALSSALPAMMQGLEQARGAMERAAANMPSPTYPRR
jgi:hypothetical protein